MIQNVVIISLLSVLQALQVLIILAAVSHAVPFHPGVFVQQIFPVYLPEVRPEREMLLFRVFVMSAAAISGAWVFLCRRKLEDVDHWKTWQAYLALNIFWVFALLFATFKILVFEKPLWAVVLFYASAVLCILSHVFWPEIKKASGACGQWFLRVGSVPGPWALPLAFIILIVIFLCPAKLDFVLGRMFLRDQFYHLDSILMAPGWAYLNGLSLNRDITSEYSVGLPIMLSSLLNWFRAFDYPGAVALIIGICIAYYAGLFFFIRMWAKNNWLGCFGVMLAIKLQMFHWGVAPLAWQFPSATALRHFPDVFFFFCLLLHIQTRKAMWFWLLPAIVGFSLFSLIDVGLYMLVALLAYTAMTQWRKLSAAFLVSIGAMFLFMAIAVPQSIFHAEFWKNQIEFAGLFVQGWGAMPMTEGLIDKQYFAFIMGFIIPVVYVFTLIYVGALWFLKQTAHEDVLIVAISVYGLGQYHYFIHRSGVTSYYAVCVPLVLVICFWIMRLCAGLPEYIRKAVPAVLACGMLFALMTGYLFTYYPNALNLSGLQWDTEAKYYQEHFDFRKDAQLISAATVPGQRVAIISSFETKILMQAKRRPFFYYSPLMESSLMDDPVSRLTYLHTTGRLEATLWQVKQQKPEYVFIEKKLLAQQGQAGLSALLKQIRNDYDPQQTGRYLIAYKRRPS